MPCPGAAKEEPRRWRVVWPGIAGLVRCEQAIAIVMSVERPYVDLHQIPVGDSDEISCHLKKLHGHEGSRIVGHIRSNEIPRCKRLGMSRLRHRALYTSARSYREAFRATTMSASSVSVLTVGTSTPSWRS